jgi:hypothetical protein
MFQESQEAETSTENTAEESTTETPAEGVPAQ